MAALYSYGNTFTTNLTANNPFLDVVNPSVANVVTKLYEIYIHNNSASSNQNYGIARSANNPVQTGGVTLIPDDSSDPASKTTIGTTWSTAPTIMTNTLNNQLFYRRNVLGAIQGAWVLHTFIRGLWLYGGQSSIMIWNIGTITTGNFCNFVVEE